MFIPENTPNNNQSLCPRSGVRMSAGFKPLCSEVVQVRQVTVKRTMILGRLSVELWSLPVISDVSPIALTAVPLSDDLNSLSPQHNMRSKASLSNDGRTARARSDPRLTSVAGRSTGSREATRDSQIERSLEVIGMSSGRLIVVLSEISQDLELVEDLSNDGHKGSCEMYKSFEMCLTKQGYVKTMLTSPIHRDAHWWDDVFSSTSPLKCNALSPTLRPRAEPSLLVVSSLFPMLSPLADNATEGRQDSIKRTPTSLGLMKRSTCGGPRGTVGGSAVVLAQASPWPSGPVPVDVYTPAGKLTCAETKTGTHVPSGCNLTQDVSSCFQSPDWSTKCPLLGRAHLGASTMRVGAISRTLPKGPWNTTMSHCRVRKGSDTPHRRRGHYSGEWAVIVFLSYIKVSGCDEDISRQADKSGRSADEEVDVWVIPRYGRLLHQPSQRRPLRGPRD
ncbi:uncharacterized protein BXZ73DRAFT_77649 [Epithele typhae]|uniref:uncharacterized protein n=1 Tax=Epithele typhae TaxID=378194 RepID=UPI0020077E58|nr:uncharacterized protein BXZ73DRAFT_77649 [Epithele typhae]KAH9931626.1 hypothetical protein BXZ73DRAFT_77649 [Epithele typhae]